MKTLVDVPITISELQAVSVSRTARWHAAGLSEWSALEWTGAINGEVGEMWEALFETMALLGKVTYHYGEAGNAAKKLQRVEAGMANINEPGRQITSLEQARLKIGKELADGFIYSVLAAARIGMDLEACVRDVFNEKSEEYGFPERVGLAEAEAE